MRHLQNCPPSPFFILIVVRLDQPLRHLVVLLFVLPFFLSVIVIRMLSLCLPVSIEFVSQASGVRAASEC